MSSMSTHSAPSRRGRRLVIAALAATGLATAGLATASSSDAAGLNLIPTTTALTASNYAPVGSTPFTLNVTVAPAIIKVGLGITPTGTVTFTATNNDGGDTQTLGTASLGFCLLTTCKASFTTTANAQPFDSELITASYNGDLLAKASSAAIEMNFNNAPADSQDTQDFIECEANVPCHTGYVSSTDGSTAFSIDQPAQPNQAYFGMHVGDDPLPCTTTGGGETATWAYGANPDHGGFTGFTGTKTVTYYAYDASATAGLAWATPHACFETDTDFVGSYEPVGTGYVNTPPGGATLHGLVPFDSAAGGYLGLLDTCASNGNVAPCIVSDASVAPPAGHTVEQKIVISVTTFDPKMSN
jgi:hypothetical protein